MRFVLFLGLSLLFLANNAALSSSADSLECQQSSLSADKLTLNTLGGQVKGSCERILVNTDGRANKSKEVFRWASIPYAEKPIDSLRFKPPKWLNTHFDNLDGTRMPKPCMQYVNETMRNIKRGELIEQMSEDCLYLNVYIPYELRAKKLHLAPIAVLFIDGYNNGFDVQQRSVGDFSPALMASLTKSIVITVQYRVGLFGFFYIQEGHVDVTSGRSNSQSREKRYPRGNYGVLDQYMALKWINKNAAHMHGDANRVTLIGHGEGSQRGAALHLTIRPSWPLFRNAVLLSGAPTQLRDQMLTAEKANARGQLFLQRFFPPACRDRQWECLLQADAKNLTHLAGKFVNEVMVDNQSTTNLNHPNLHSSYSSSSSNLTVNALRGEAFLPVVDNQVFKQSTIRSFRLGEVKKCNLIVGFSVQDGASEIPTTFSYKRNESIHPSNSNNNFFSDGYHHSTKSLRNFHQKVNASQLVKFVKEYFQFYPTWPQRSDEVVVNSILSQYARFTLRGVHNQHATKLDYFKTLSSILTDEKYACPTIKMADFLTDKFKSRDQQNNKVFMMIYNYGTNSTRLNILDREEVRSFAGPKQPKEPLPRHYGVVNGDILPMLFGEPFNASTRTPRYSMRDKIISRNFLVRLTNFIATNDPNSPSTSNLRGPTPKFWPAYKKPSEFDATSQQSVNKHESLYLSVKTNATTIGKIQRTSCHVWNNLIPSQIDAIGEMLKHFREGKFPENEIGKYFTNHQNHN